MSTILIVDDADASRTVMATILQADRHRLLLACRGDDALEMIREERPDVVLLDLDLPGLHGWDVITAVRAEPVLGDVGIIVFTGKTVAEGAQRAAALGCVGFLHKPVDMHALRQLIRTHGPRS